MSTSRLRERWPIPATAAAGIVLMVLGWYGISGRVSLGEQLPYLASGTIPGAALLVVAAVLRSGERSHDDATAAQIDELHRLLTEAVNEPPEAPPAP